MKTSKGGIIFAIAIGFILTGGITALTASSAGQAIGGIAIIIVGGIIGFLGRNTARHL